MFTRIVQISLAAAVALTLGMLGCGKQQPKQEAMQEEEKPMQEEEKTMMQEETMMREAVAQMNPTEGNEAHGMVTFKEVDGGIRVIAHFEGVPEGEHGFHIHEFGDCSSPDGTSAGGHFNPEGNPHAGPDVEMRHVGDLGNITANAEGVAEKDFVDAMLSFEGSHSIVGKGVILHADPDDLTTQPTGAAGARISCGVIEMSSGEEMSEEEAMPEEQTMK